MRSAAVILTEKEIYEKKLTAVWDEPMEYWNFSERIMDQGQVVSVKPFLKYEPESCLERLLELYARRRPDILFFADTIGGREMAARLAGRAGGRAALGASRIWKEGGGIRIQKGAYGSNMQAVYALNQTPVCITLRGTAGQTRQNRKKADKGTGEGAEEKRQAICEEIPLKEDFQRPWLLEEELLEETKDEGLASGEVVLAGGRGLRNKASFETLKQTAERLEGVSGASRPAVLNAWAPMECLIGQSGTYVAPKVMAAFGISGSSPFMAGTGAERLAAVNQDPDAPIFQYADLGIVGDAREILEELFQLTKQDGKEGGRE